MAAERRVQLPRRIKHAEPSDGSTDGLGTNQRRSFGVNCNEMLSGGCQPTRQLEGYFSRLICTARWSHSCTRTE